MSQPPALLLRAAAMAALALGLVSAGCGTSERAPGNDAPSPTSATPTTTATPTTPKPEPASTNGQAPAPTRTVSVYFADASAQGLVQETHPTAATGSDLRAALVELADGPDGAGLQPSLPTGTVIVGTDVRNGTATVNLSQEFVSGYPSGGAAAEFAVVAPLVYTATGVSGVERVRITVDGQTPAPTGSQLDWSGMFTRQDFPAEVATP